MHSGCRTRYLQLVTAIVVLAFAASTQAAQRQAAQGITIYPAVSFNKISPVNAYDMVTRLPGFVIVEADPDVRGYSGALGNVLIDGARPASKHEDIKDLLKRIPAASVKEIDLLRDGASDIDMGGYTMVANVVRRHDVKSETIIEAGLMGATGGWLSPSGQIQHSNRRAGHAFDLSAKFEPELDDDSGHGHIRTTRTDGEAGKTENLNTRTIKNKGEANAHWRQELAGGQLSLSTAVRGERARNRTEISAAGASDGKESVRENENTNEAEFGLHFEKSFNSNTRANLLVTQHLAWLNDLENSREDGEKEVFEETSRSGESIGRFELDHAQSETLSIKSSLEGAFNFQQSKARLDKNDSASTIPGSDVRIEERRSEASLSAIWKPSRAWVLDAGLRVEKSAIQQTGDTPRQRSFIYYKPRLAALWNIGKQNQLRLSLAREVGQLDFSDFVASASLDSDLVSAGNAELEPDKTWRLTTVWEHHFTRDAAATVTWTHDRIEDVIDRVLISTGDDVYDAPGNIGNGRRDTLALDLSTPLDGLGVSGARVRMAMLWQKSRVTDPVTGTRRAISGEKPVEGEIELSQHLAASNTNWGIKLEHIAERKTKYRYDEVKRESESMGWTLYLERSFGRRWRMRAQATDLFGRGFVEVRQKYAGSRARDPISKVERRERTSPGYISLTFRRSMGDQASP